MIVGTTYSHRHAHYLKLSAEQTLTELLNLGFGSIRLACYWEECEAERGVYDYTQIRTLLDACEKRKQKVILSVGMKAPRWPEYYLPRWLVHASPDDAFPHVTQFLQHTVKTLQSYDCITHWQVENEPLDPSGASNFCLTESLLAKEVAVVRSVDTRPIVINLWGNELTKRKLLEPASRLADVIGLDLYYKVPFAGAFYRGPEDSDETLGKIIDELIKPVFITELQAEPWENNVLFSRAKQPKSMNAELLRKNFERAAKLRPEAIYLWGYEYWMWKKAQGDMSLWQTVRELLATNQA